WYRTEHEVVTPVGWRRWCRHDRRMLRRGGPTRGALALTGAAVVLALSVGCQQQERQSPAPTVSRPSATATPAQVLTTPSPIGLAIAGDGLWVANSGSGE